MSDRNNRIVWCDVETTGLDPAGGHLLEVAMVVTEEELTVVDSIDVVIHADNDALAVMDDYVRRMHTDNGLLDEVRVSDLDLRAAELALHDFLSRTVPSFDRERRFGAPLAGNNIKFDRSWLAEHLPRVVERLHYRDICVSSMAEIMRRFFPDLWLDAPRKRRAHRAMDDIHESIKEMRHYLDGLGTDLPPVAVDSTTGRIQPGTVPQFR